MTFEPGARVEPAALEAAVRKVDFTPRGVTLWVRGRITQSDQAATSAVWLQGDGERQRFRLVASDDGDRARLQAVVRSAAGAVTISGTATGPDDNGVVTIQVQGIHDER